MDFALGEAKLKPEHVEFLHDKVYFGTLTSDPMAKISIIGHADSTGSKSINDRLAKKRALEVETALRSYASHLLIDTVTGKGANEPLAENDSVLGRAKNRRVEILVTPWKPEKPVPELLTEMQKGMKPFVINVDNFAVCPFPDTVKSIVEEAFKPIKSIRFDWEGKSASDLPYIDFDDTTLLPQELGLRDHIFLTSFKNNEICKTEEDPLRRVSRRTCEKVFPEKADVMGRAIANTVVHEKGHQLGLDHVPTTDNFMWDATVDPLNSKKDKTFDEKVFLQRTLPSMPETFNASQLVHMVNTIKEMRKVKPGVKFRGATYRVIDF